MMLAPFLLVLSFALTKDRPVDNAAIDDEDSKNEAASFMTRVKQVKVPWFAFIFILIVLLHTWIPMSKSIEQSMVMLDDVMLTMAMFALGLTTHMSAIKQAGVKPLILGAVMFAWLLLGGGVINIAISSFA